MNNENPTMDKNISNDPLNEKNIGNNKTCTTKNTRYVLGSKDSFYIIILYTILIITTVSIWSIFLYTFVHLSLFIINLLFAFITIFNYLASFCKEPGIIPKRSKDFQIKQSEEHQPINKESPINKDNENNNKEVLLVSPSSSDERIALDKKNIQNKNENKKTNENNQTNNNDNNKEDQKINPTPNIFTKRECKTCFIIRPPTASHCSICGNCVLGFDQ